MDASQTQRSIGVQFSLGVGSLRTHVRACMPVLEASRRETLKSQVLRGVEALKDSPMMARILLVEDVGIKMLEDCERTGDARNASAIMGHLLRASELVGKRLGELVDKRETREIHHGGVMVLGLPQVPEAPPRGVLAAPREGQDVDPEVTKLGTTLDAIEAELVENGPEIPEDAS